MKFSVKQLLVTATITFLLYDAAASESGTVFLSFSQIDDTVFSSLPVSEKGNPPLNDNSLFAAGIFNDSSFSVGNLHNLAVTDNEDQAVPVYACRKSTVSEFGKIISVRIIFPVTSAGKPVKELSYKISWDPSVSNSLVSIIDNWSVAAESSTRYLSFQWTQSPPDAADGQLASIEIIADSKANYYSLWYLLPMALIFILLTVRKITAGKADDN